VELAIRRILLLHGMILTFGGIPLLYLGDEVATLNDYTYYEDYHKTRDSRWVTSSIMQIGKNMKNEMIPNLFEGKVYQGLQKLIALRKENEAFSGNELELIPTENEHVLAFRRTSRGASQSSLFR